MLHKEAKNKLSSVLCVCVYVSKESDNFQLKNEILAVA